MTQTLARLKAKRASDEGFTLIELMVVVLIIAVLLAIAIPTFIGARSSSQDRAAQSSARNALTAAKVIQSNSGNYTGATAAGLATVEPSLTYSAGTTASTGPNNVSVSSTSGAFGAAVLSQTGTCWRITDTASGTSYDSITTACTPSTTALTGSW